MNIEKQQGFNLIELPIVVALIGIVVAIILPAFFEYHGESKVRKKTSHGYISMIKQCFFPQVKKKTDLNHRLYPLCGYSTLRGSEKVHFLFQS